MPAGDLARLALGGAGRGKDQPLLHHLATDAGRDLVDELGEGLAHLAAHVGERDHMHHDADVLPAGVMELHKELRPVTVDALRELAHGLDVIVVRHGELVERRGAVIVVDAGDLRKDETGATLRALLIVVHQHLGGLAVRRAEPHHHGGHHDTVLDLASAYLHRRKQHFEFHIFSLCRASAALPA